MAAKGIIEFPRKQRYWRSFPYDAPPQSPDLDADGNAREMAFEEIVEGLLYNDPNCLEWAGRDIRIVSPLAAPLDRETHSFCTSCGQTKEIKHFYRDNRKSNGVYSECRACNNERRTLRYHTGKLEKWRRAA